MAPSLAEYSQLPMCLQSALLLEGGTPLMWRIMLGKYHTVLYSLGTYFVEASWDRSWNLNHIHAFRDVAGLTPYLLLIDWQELV
jgi:hypothetical protein